LLHHVGDLFELNVKLRCQKVNAILPSADLLQTANLICVDAITTECARLELVPLLLS
jgi:hypothetical protein